ncbi:MAG TPA: fatty acid desaturase, partial [Mycobacterium sp.]|nr:fatty acid desaturase [Mycobacterium sp.]
LSSVRYLLSNRLVTSDKDQGPTWDRKAFLATWIVLIGILAATGNLSYLPLFWIVPYFTTFQIITWFIELAEHTPLLKHSDHNLYLSRNRKSRGIEWFLTSMHAENYHLDHHLDPRTPFWNMRHANAIRRHCDRQYRQWDNQAGGLFQKGKNGQPGAIRRIIDNTPEMPESRDAVPC